MVGHHGPMVKNPTANNLRASKLLIPPSVIRPFGIILLSPSPFFASLESCLSHKFSQPKLIKLVTTYFTPQLCVGLYIRIISHYYLTHHVHRNR